MMIVKGKRALSLLLVLCMLTLLLPVSVFAANESLNNLWASGGKPSDMSVTVKNNTSTSDSYTHCAWTDATLNGSNCIKSTNLDAGNYYTMSELQVSFTVPDGKTAYVMFDYAVGTSSNNYFRYICDEKKESFNDNTVTSASQLEWNTVQYCYGEGKHTITLQFQVNNHGSGLDVAYVKDLKISYEPVYAGGTLTVDYDDTLGAVYADGQLVKPNEPLQLLKYHNKVRLEPVEGDFGYFDDAFSVYDATSENYTEVSMNGSDYYTLNLNQGEDSAYIMKADFDKREYVYITAAQYNDTVGTLWYKLESESDDEYKELLPLERSEKMLSHQTVDLKVVPKEGYDDTLYSGGAKCIKDGEVEKNLNNEPKYAISPSERTGSIFLTPSTSAESDYTTVIDLNIATTDFIEVENIAYGVEEMTTRGNLPWTLNEDGEYMSGNQGIDQSISLLRLKLKGNGTLVFDYKVISDSTDYLSLCYGDEPTDYLKVTTKLPLQQADSRWLGSGLTEYTEWNKQCVHRVTDKADDEEFYVYIVYAKSYNTSNDDDTAWVRNIAYVSGTATVTAKASDDAYGTVKVETLNDAGETEVAAPAYNCGSSLKVTAEAKDGYVFYGWMNNTTGKLASTQAAYTFAVTQDAALEAVFAPKDTYEAQSENGFYENLATAIKEAESGTVRVLKNAELSESATVGGKVTLLLPYSNSDNKGYLLNDATVASPTIAIQDPYITVTVPQGMSLDVNGKVIVGGVRHSVGQDAQGQTSGAYAALKVDGSLNVNSGGYLDVNGLISGNGTTNLASGGTTRMPYLVLDYAGGQNTAALYMNDSFPFGNYATMNIQNTFVMQGGGHLIGSTSLYFWSVITTQDVDLVSTNSGLILLPEGSTLTANYNKDRAVKQRVGNINLSYFGKTTLTIDGGASFGGFRLSGYGSESMYLNIPYTYDLNLTNGNYSMPYYYRIMPGAELEVASDATLTVESTGGLQAVDGWQAKDKSGKQYPPTETLRSNGFNVNGCLTVNGTLKIADRATLGGIVSTETAGAQVITGKSAVLDKQDFFGGSERGFYYESTGTYENNYCTYALPARIRVNDQLVTLMPASSYKSSGGSEWTLDSYTMKAYSIENDTVSISQKMNGVWNTPVTVTFNLNGPTVKETTQLSYQTTCGEVLDTTLLYSELATPTYPYNANVNNAFLGWFTEKDGGEQVNLETYTFTGESTTLYAHWTMHTHSNQQTTTIPATCTEDGSTTTTCLICGEVISTTVIEALGHDMQPATETQPEHCSRCSYTVGEPLGGAKIINSTCYDSTDSSRFTVTNYSELARTIVVTKTAGAGYTYIVEATVNGSRQEVAMNTNIALDQSKDTTAYYTYPEGTTEISVTAVLKGDVNGDGSINAKDITSIKNHMTNKRAFTGWNQTLASDVNGDGSINAKDITSIKNHMTNKRAFN